MRILNPPAVGVKTVNHRYFPSVRLDPGTRCPKSNDLARVSLKFSIICLGTTTKGARFNSRASCSWIGVASQQRPNARNVPFGDLGGNSTHTIAPWWLWMLQAVSQHPAFGRKSWGERSGGQSPLARAKRGHQTHPEGGVSTAGRLGNKGRASQPRCRQAPCGRDEVTP